MKAWLRTAVLVFARLLARAAARLRTYVTTDMNMSEYLAFFGQNMMTHNLNTTCGFAGGSAPIEGGARLLPVRVFTFVTTDPAIMAGATEALAAAGCLSDGPFSGVGTRPVHEAVVVASVVSGLRALHRAERVLH